MQLALWVAKYVIGTRGVVENALAPGAAENAVGARGGEIGN